METKSAKGELKKPFAEDQTHALVDDITAELPKLIDAMKRNKISRVEAALIILQADKALADVKKAKFGDTGSS